MKRPTLVTLVLLLPVLSGVYRILIVWSLHRDGEQNRPEDLACAPPGRVRVARKWPRSRVALGTTVHSAVGAGRLPNSYQARARRYRQE